MHQKNDIKDRNLGDEWQAWSGSIQPPENIRASNGLFLFLFFIIILGLIASGFFLIYMIAPRLEQYAANLSRYLFVAMIIVSSLALLWFLIIMLTSITGDQRFCFCIGNRFFYGLASIASTIGRRLGISRDKVGHSLIKVSNALALASIKSSHSKRVLVLLPRCLTKEARRRALDICSRFRVIVKTAGGGEAARNFVRSIRPDAVIGIACERDLVSGIQDIAPRIPVLGIPNIRPEGPCKSTYIDYNDLEETLIFLCGKSSLGTKDGVPQ